MSSQRETLQKHQGNQTNIMSDLANQNKPDKNEFGHSRTSFTHKVSSITFIMNGIIQEN